MDPINRREFAGATLAALGAAAMSCASAPAGQTQPGLPTVRWGRHGISRLLVGHNPIKGVSHFTPELSREMRTWFAGDPARARELLRRCEQLGINTCQIGGEDMEALLRAHWAEGGRLQWIATFYSQPGEGKQELARILNMTPGPIGIQQHGNMTDRLMREGKIDQVQDNLKRFRDAGVLVGLGSHNHEAIDYAESKGWDVDFYQGAFYRSSGGLDQSKGREVFEEEARQSMAKTLGQVSKPCIAYKILGANRHCQTPADVEAAIRFALKSIKPSDVILVGMWQKYKDQVADNVGFVQKILGTASIA